MSREEEVLDQFVDEDEVISPRLLFCKYFDQALRSTEERIGRELSSKEHKFVTLQFKKNQLIILGKKRKRSVEENAALKKLNNKINFARRTMEHFDDRLLFKPASQAKSPAERQSKRKERRTAEEVEKENNVERVRLVAKRAGGLSEARLVDVRAGQSKNKSSSVYSGDALRNQEILQGTFIVDKLSEGSPDFLGALGTLQCNFCGALKCFQITNIFLCCLSVFAHLIQVERRDQPFNVLPWWTSQAAERSFASL